MSAVVAPDLTIEETERFAQLVIERNWTDLQIRSLGLRCVEETGSRTGSAVVRWILAWVEQGES